MNEMNNFMKDIGLTSTEIKVYLALLNIGESLAGKIALEAKLHRKNTYDALNSLLKNGLVVYVIKKGKKSWKVISPEKIRSVFEEKLSLIDKFLPKLMSKFNEKKSDQTIEVFEGKEGMKSFYDFVLKQEQINDMTDEMLDISFGESIPTDIRIKNNGSIIDTKGSVRIRARRK